MKVRLLADPVRFLLPHSVRFNEHDPLLLAFFDPEDEVRVEAFILEKDRRVTYQLVMNGSDGTVVASDLCERLVSSLGDYGENQLVPKIESIALASLLGCTPVATYRLFRQGSLRMRSKSIMRK